MPRSFTRAATRELATPAFSSNITCAQFNGSGRGRRQPRVTVRPRSKLADIILPKAGPTSPWKYRNSYEQRKVASIRLATTERVPKLNHEIRHGPASEGPRRSVERPQKASCSSRMGRCTIWDSVSQGIYQPVRARSTIATSYRRGSAETNPDSSNSRRRPSRPIIREGRGKWLQEARMCGVPKIRITGLKFPGKASIRGL